jgi:hypothetical protein
VCAAAVRTPPSPSPLFSHLALLPKHSRPQRRRGTQVVVVGPRSHSYRQRGRQGVGSRRAVATTVTIRRFRAGGGGGGAGRGGPMRARGAGGDCGAGRAGRRCPGCGARGVARWMHGAARAQGRAPGAKNQTSRLCCAKLFLIHNSF